MALCIIFALYNTHRLSLSLSLSLSIGTKIRDFRGAKTREHKVVDTETFDLAEFKAHLPGPCQLEIAAYDGFNVFEVSEH